MLKLKNLLFTVMLGAPVIMAASDSSASSSCSSECDSPTSQNLWQPHAFSNYALREVLIMKGLDLEATGETWVNRFGFASEYMQSFGHNCAGIGAMPFWSGSNTMTIGNNDGKADLDAYQFGLGNVEVNGETGVGGTITLNPKVQHVGTDLLWYGMQNEDKVGAYAKVKIPLGAMRITSDLCQSPVEQVENDVIPGYFVAPLRFNSVGAALQGGTNLQDPLYAYGKIAACPKTVIRLGDITAALGANFIAKENSLFGAAFKVSCPTGNVPQALYMLEPVFGRAGHWGVGGEIQGRYRHELDSDKCGIQYINFWMQAEAMHLFSGRKPSFRSFDLKANGKGSKYLLLQHYHYNNAGTAFVSDYVIPAINVTTLPVVSTFAVEGNIAAMIDFVRDDWNLSIGGEFWGRSGEKLSVDCCVNDDRNNFFTDYNLNDYAVLGRQQMNIDGQTTTTWCQPLAKINQSVDAYRGVGPVPAGVEDGALAQNRIPADYNKALDICGAQADRIYTGKVLGEIGYTWSQHCHVPHLSVFGGAEFSANKNNWVNLWSVGLQGSVQF